MPYYFLLFIFKKKNYGLIFLCLVFCPFCAKASFNLEKKINERRADLQSAEKRLNYYLQKKDTVCVIDSYSDLSKLYRGTNDSLAAEMLFKKIKLVEAVSESNTKNELYFSQIESKIKTIELQKDKKASEKNVYRMTWLFIGIMTLIFILLYFLYKKNKKIKDVFAKVSYSNEVKTNFLSNISQEVLQPLDIIEENSLRFREEKIDKEQETYITNIFNASRNLRVMTTDFFDFNEHKSQKYKLILTEENLNEFIKEIHESVKLEALKKPDLNINIFATTTFKDLLIFDKFKLQQVLHNLFNNAIKFTEQGGINLRIDLLSQNEHYCEILFEVSDTGKGIKPENIPIIFDEFYQEDSEYTRHYSGTGLGLSISQKIIESMNSKIYVESILGSGSRFYFVLQLKKVEHV